MKEKRYFENLIPKKLVGYPNTNRNLVEVISVILFVFVISFILGFTLDNVINWIINIILNNINSDISKINLTYTSKIDKKLNKKELITLSLLCIVQFILYIYIIIILYENIQYNYPFTQQYLFSLLNVVGIAFSTSQKYYMANIKRIFSNTHFNKYIAYN